MPDLGWEIAEEKGSYYSSKKLPGISCSHKLSRKSPGGIHANNFQFFFF